MIENPSQLLRQQGIKPTKVRVALCRLFLQGPPLVTAAELLALLLQQQKINKVTVYRNLELFRRHGLIRPVRLGERACLYEWVNRCPQRHPHFYCRLCGEIQCLQPVDPQHFWELLPSPSGNLVQSLEIRVEGVCHRCWSQRATEAAPTRGGD